MTKGKRIFRQLPSKGVFAAYSALLDEGLMPFPITQEAERKVGAIVANINSIYFGQSPYESPEEKAVAYLYFLINDHPFTDGNKRTATLSFLMVCDVNNLKPQFKNFSLDQLAVFIEKVTGDHHKTIKAVATLLFKG